MHIPQRPYWSGEPADLGELFRLRKIACQRQIEAVCTLHTHQFGWECRLMAAEELLRSEVCRTQEAVGACSEQWKVAMIERGWS